MRLHPNEIRAKAVKFAEDFKDARYEKSETQTFYNEFFEIFGVKRRRVASFEEPVKRLGKKNPGYIDLFWKGVLLVEQKTAGRDLAQAKTQAFSYFPGLNEGELPRYLLVCDFQNFELYDLDTGKEVKFALKDLPAHIEAFGFISGGKPREFKDQDPVNIRASELLGKLHDALHASGFQGHDLERFLVRLVFCLFADDTGIFAPRGIFEDFVRERTNEDGSDLGPKLEQLFQAALNTHSDRRLLTLDADLRDFPYINGELFAERLTMPAFDGTMRKLLLDACGFNWERISPAIFGALFQSVMDKNKRRAVGAHYTTEQNILKVIQPLFLDQLRSELDALKARRDNGRARAFREFQTKLASINLFDPACGCGNFLVIAYRELRLLETEVLIEISKNQELDVTQISQVDVHQLHGIEVEEFPARIAEVATWMMDHIMNVRLSEALGGYFPRIPLKAAPNIRHGDALEIDWASVIPPERCTYILGNPPFIGAKYQTPAQRAQVQRVAALGKKRKGTLDYVAAWFIRAGEYIQKGTAKIGFVATNSITQGEQVAELWPILLKKLKLAIEFAHRTFEWGSEARGKAHVHVVIVGLARDAAAAAKRRLFTYMRGRGDPVETTVKSITPYLTDGGGLSDAAVVVHETTKCPPGRPSIMIGSQPIDFEQYVLDKAARDELLARYPALDPYIRPYLGAEELVNGAAKWVLFLRDLSPNQLRAMPTVLKRVEAVQRRRAASKRKQTRRIAPTPLEFGVTVAPPQPFLAIPKVGSERRDYIPIGWVQPPVIPSDLVFVLPNADLSDFAVLTSRMHMAWMNAVGGRLKSDPRYSAGLVYNTFPWPDLDAQKRTKLRALAQAVLDARQDAAPSSLGALYDPRVMPARLRKAHDKLDAYVDKLYRSGAFSGDEDRVGHLLGLYAAKIMPLLPVGQRKRRAKVPVAAVA